MRRGGARTEGLCHLLPKHRFSYSASAPRGPPSALPAWPSHEPAHRFRVITFRLRDDALSMDSLVAEVARQGVSEEELLGFLKPTRLYHDVVRDIKAAGVKPKAPARMLPGNISRCVL